MVAGSSPAGGADKSPCVWAGPDNECAAAVYRPEDGCRIRAVAIAARQQRWSRQMDFASRLRVSKASRRVPSRTGLGTVRPMGCAGSTGERMLLADHRKLSCLIVTTFRGARRRGRTRVRPGSRRRLRVFRWCAGCAQPEQSKIPRIGTDVHRRQHRSARLVLDRVRLGPRPRRPARLNPSEATMHRSGGMIRFRAVCVGSDNKVEQPASQTYVGAGAE